MSVSIRLAMLTCGALGLAGIIGGCANDGAPKAGGKSQAIETYVKGVYAYKAGEEDKAVDTLRAAIQENPQLIMPRTILGRISKEKGDYAAAAEYYQALTQLDPYEVNHHYQLGVSYQMLTRLQDAAKSYRTALKLDPDNFGSNMNLGLIYMTLGETDNAVRFTKRAVEINPDSSEAQANMAVALDSAGEYEAAEIAYRKSLELAPKQSGTLINYANNLLAQEKWRDAIEVLQETLKMEDTPYLHKRLGDAYVGGGQYDLAMQQYNQAVQKNPRYYAALNEQARVSVLQYQAGMELEDKKRDDALAFWRRSLEIYPNQPSIKVLLEDWERRMFSK